MEVQGAAEEVLCSNSSGSNMSNGIELLHGAVVKGKRTKRPRATTTLPLPLPESSTSASSAEAGAVTEEEEDLAKCLILLAQGRGAALHGAHKKPGLEHKDEVFAGAVRTERSTSRRLQLAEEAMGNPGGAYVYECKTCGKCFPSFQALGGHRTSHKKSKLATSSTTAEEKKLVVDDDHMLQISMNSFSKPIPGCGGGRANAKSKVHECSICGAEFSSGQALGGHMRRHRPLPIAAVDDSQEAAKKEKSFLSFDLNLPAPADDELLRQPSPAAAASLTLAGKRPLIFSASASALVVDCHY